MANPKPKKDRDEITVAKSIFDEIVKFTEETPKEGRARKGGSARAENLTPEERSEIARIAAIARWKKQKK
ncbi:MAG TPA: hypothetical protein PKD26_06465 [Pyrinomonadaceae bacterium]|nr:hypothetical protein [Pyrinomonadaceae bacterium]